MIGLLDAVFAEGGHGPGRNPWWVNAILIALVLGGLVVWRIRLARRKRWSDSE